MRALISLLLLSLLAACGQKGPLYFAPKQAPATQKAAPAAQPQAEPADTSEQDDASEQD